ncbi:MAG: hypothetical protein TU35_009395 [Thermoproteus sp. AZ2]|uniref:Uncharacterized protein n=1 Tax=Thermoproteus sp. AZ2 TaxID=1609232 RepID=A0ACC6V3A6_9CREN
MKSEKAKNAKAAASTLGKYGVALRRSAAADNRAPAGAETANKAQAADTVAAAPNASKARLSTYYTTPRFKAWRIGRRGAQQLKMWYVG